MRVTWTSKDAGFHVAECRLGTRGLVHLLVESLGEHGWDWQVWDPVRRLRARYGVADTLEAAKVRAELAVAEAMACAGAVLTDVLAALDSLSVTACNQPRPGARSSAFPAHNG